MKLACSDNKINVIHGFFVALCTMLDLAFIVLSYTLILKTVLSIASLAERLKTLIHMLQTVQTMQGEVLNHVVWAA